MEIFPTKILLATDGSEHAGMAAQAAVELAEKTDSELHVTHVGAEIPPQFAYAELNPEQVEAKSRERLEEFAKQVEEIGGKVAGSHLQIGDPAERVVALAEEIEAGLIVVGSRGLTGLRRSVMGSVSSKIVSHAHCPVMVVRKDGR